MIILIGIGGSLGAITRFLIGRWISANAQTNFPFGTLIINITGSFLLGLLVSLHTKHMIPETIWATFAVGFLGSYTTFSTFSFEAFTLILSGKKKQFFLYITSSIFVCIVFAWLGMMI